MRFEAAAASSLRDDGLVYHAGRFVPPRASDGAWLLVRLRLRCRHVCAADDTTRIVLGARSYYVIAAASPSGVLGGRRQTSIPVRVYNVPLAFQQAGFSVLAALSAATCLSICLLYRIPITCSWSPALAPKPFLTFDGRDDVKNVNRVSTSGNVATGDQRHLGGAGVARAHTWCDAAGIATAGANDAKRG